MMNFIKLLLFVFYIVCYGHIYSQSELKWGFRIGSGTSKITFSEINMRTDSVIYNISPQNKKDVNANLGFFVRKEWDWLFLQSEMLYTLAAGDVIKSFDYIYAGSGKAYSAKYFIHINIPILFGIHAEPFNIHFGPALSYLISKKDLRYLPESDEKLSLSYIVGAEIAFNKLFFSARYSNNITPIIKKATFLEQEFDYNLKTPQLMCSIGYVW